MKSIRLTNSQLITVLNWLVTNGYNSFTVDTPFCNSPIIKVKLSSSSTEVDVSIIATKSDFTKEARTRDYSFTVIIESLYAAGIVLPSGWQELSKNVDSILARDVYKGQKLCRIAFDTVALNRRYYSVLERYVRLKKELNSSQLTYIITTGIQKELTRYDKKYHNKDIRDLENIFHVNWFNFTRFRNQLSTKDRIFRLGDVEVKKMKASGRCERITSAPTDQYIIEALANYSRKNNVDILAVSEDSDFVSRCISQEIMAIRLDRRPITENIPKTSWANLCDLLYVLAVRMGVIRIKWKSDEWAIIEGIWLGKKGESWDNEEMQIYTDVKQFYKPLALVAVILRKYDE